LRQPNESSFVQERHHRGCSRNSTPRRKAARTQSDFFITKPGNQESSKQSHGFLASLYGIVLGRAFAVLSPDFAHFCKDSCRGARVAQIYNLLYRRIASGGAPAVARSSASDAASGLQIRDTAEYNSALRWLRLRRARPWRLCIKSFSPDGRLQSLAVCLAAYRKVWPAARTGAKGQLPMQGRAGAGLASPAGTGAGAVQIK